MPDPQGPVIQVRLEDLPPEGGAPAPPRSAPGRRVRTLAWTALVLGVISILFAGVAVGPVAVLTGIVAAVQADRRDGDGRHALIACGGILCGIAGTILWAVLILHWMDRTPAAAGMSASIPPLTPGTLDRAAIEQAPEPVRRALTSSASLLVERRAGTGWVPDSSGSGTFVKQEGESWYILTCAHVVASAASDQRRLRVQWVGGGMTDPRVEWTGTGVDLAIVRTGASESGEGPSIAPIDPDPVLRVGDPVFAVGDPHHYRVSYVSGVLSAVRIVQEGAVPMRVIQSQIPLNPGNSGGGLYSTAGRLIAVNSWKRGGADAEGMGFSIAIDNLWGVIQSAPLGVAQVIEGLRSAATEPSKPRQSGPPAQR